MVLRVAIFLVTLNPKPVRLLLAADSVIGGITLDLHTSLCFCLLDELLDDTLVVELNVRSPGECLMELGSSSVFLGLLGCR